MSEDGERERSKKAGLACDGLDCLGDGASSIDCIPGCDCSPFLLLPAALRISLGACRASAVDPHTRPRGLTSRLAARLVRSYQVNVSAHRPTVCNLSPTCSRYGLQALGEHGVFRAGVLIRRRLLACRAAGRARRR